MNQIKAHFKDEKHEEDIIINSLYEDETTVLSFVLDGIDFFCIGAFEDFEIRKESDTNDAIQKFSILKWGGKNHGGKKYSFELQRYSLEVEIPTKLICKIDGEELGAVIKFSVTRLPYDPTLTHSKTYLDEELVYPDEIKCDYFNLIVDGGTYPADEPCEFFEISLRSIRNNIKDKYIMKNCYACKYSDYSCFGHHNFGDMICFKEIANEYFKVLYKSDEFFAMQDSGKHGRRETDLCESFEERIGDI